MTTPAYDTLLVIPCYKESARLPVFLRELCLALAKLGAVHVVVVDDGSGVEEIEATRAEVDALRQEHPFLRPLLSLPVNIGKGGAVYAGWRETRGEAWLGFVDADGSCPATEVCSLIELAREQPPPGGALFASRVKILGKKVERLFSRHLLGRVYATLVSELLDIPVYDSQCGLKLLPAAAWRQIKDSLQVTGFSFDVELLCRLLDSGWKVTEVPIDWHETPGSHIRLLRDSWRMFSEVLEIKRRRVR
jgi:dolichyl-phosphate beta-glucosyltransferase